jgi:prevent-host-death family protein
VTIIVTMSKRAPQTIAAGEFKAKCLELMDRVASTGQSVVITKRGTPVARLVPIVERPATLRGFLGKRIEIEGDIVAPLDLEWNVER